jgi:phosphate:Na+ symporter
MRRIPEILTSNPIMGVIVEAGITGLVQSSSATTVAVIMGANTGTTFTAQVIAFELTEFALPAIAVGVFMSLVAKRPLHRNVAQVFVGFGMLFLGMPVITSAMKPLKDIPARPHGDPEPASLHGCHYWHGPYRWSNPPAPP